MRRSRRGDVRAFHVMEVMKAAEARMRAGGDVLHLEVGQPSTPAPPRAIEAAASALREEPLAYTAATGTAELRSAIAAHYDAHYGLRVNPDRVVVTAGASAGCVLAFLASFDAGARVAVTEPGYPCYRNILEAFDVEVVGLPVGPWTDYRVTPSQLQRAGRLDGLVIASPANPTGTILPRPALAELVSYCQDRDITLVADEIYHRIEYGPPAPTAAAYPGVVVVQSFSKYYSMTGWRIGWLVLPPDLVPAVERLAQNLYISPPTLSQRAAIEAFASTPELDANVERYATNRTIVLEGLSRLGLTDIAPPDGAFYVYADVSNLTSDSPELCRTWLEELGVAVTPGIDFDPDRGRHHVRFCYAGTTEDVRLAMERLVAWHEKTGS